MGGSRQYVNKIVANSEFNLHLNCPVALVRRETDQVIVHTKSGEQHKFDEVVFACHADAALGLLANPTPLEHELLGKFSYSNNLTVMHTDESQMPRRKKIWSSWNYLANREGAGQEEASSVTYWMNNLQRLPTNSDIFVSVNPDDRINKEKVLYATEYRHPVFTVEAVGAQKALWNLQGRNRSWFCGSYFGYGFHEDGLQSGLAVAEQLGGEKRPWQVADESGRIHLGSQPWLEAAE